MEECDVLVDELRVLYRVLIMPFVEGSFVLDAYHGNEKGNDKRRAQ